jgi:citrate synthase
LILGIMTVNLDWKINMTFFSASEAAAELGISLASLYAYASRGLLRSEAVPGDPRARRYPREDVLRLKEKKEQRKEPEKVAPKALSWGAPVLESALTLVQDGRLYYRGRDAIELARAATVEQVAALIWTGDEAEAAALFQEPPPELPAWTAPLFSSDLTPVERCQVALPIAGAADVAAWDLRPAALPATCVRILRFLTGIAAGRPVLGGLAETLQAGWAPDRPEAAGPIASALILSADHELNVSAFTARCVASAAASPWDVVSAGLPRSRVSATAATRIAAKPCSAKSAAPPKPAVPSRTASAAASSSPASGNPFIPREIREEKPCWSSPPPPRPAPPPWRPPTPSPKPAAS